MSADILCLQSILIYGWEGKARSDRDSDKEKGRAVVVKKY